jgi:two-component system response regulator HydG
MPSLLIVDDLLSIHEMLAAVIQPKGFATTFATDGEKGLARYKADKFDLVLADIDMKPMDGITLLKQLKQYDPTAVVIIMTAYASTESAVQALKYGAFDYLQKPFRVDELLATLQRALEYRSFHAERAAAAGGAKVKSGDLEARLVGTSPAVKKLVQQVKKLIAVRTPVLLSGEAGTGKGVVAEILHGLSGAPEAPLVRIDCSLSNEANFHAGLLGENGEGGTWVKQAKGGTLYLSNIHRLPLPLQQELVSVLRNNAQGFRLVCSTNQDLEAMADEGKFHDELFYRVASLPVRTPALRERTGDLALLAKHFAAQVTNPHFDASLVEFSDDALAVLTAYDWPGNLAELNQVVSQIASTTDTRIVTSAQLPMRLREVKAWPTLAQYLAGQEKQYIERVLHASKGNKATAAKVLGIDPAKLG